LPQRFVYIRFAVRFEAFASMFDDSELARLQENLETIARRAESALRQLSGRA